MYDSVINTEIQKKGYYLIGFTVSDYVLIPFQLVYIKQSLIYRNVSLNLESIYSWLLAWIQLTGASQVPETWHL